ncbi:UDP-Glc:alpha-D-GlcNAc-diphosphoundecaprenol beta-1,3-glucosyltransferase WfgD [Lachnospiraceae bacterium]|nr:UDP-Glc:alpha-D-GlcNAc-diphosphoundecaprenol beta-1,3-glucosyltransferase WfgD [Lachnospiraceae bacterium]
MPLVSVVMPAYNAEKYICIAIESILNQTYKDFELIIIEDGSEDSTLEKIELYNDTRIRLICNKENRGIAYATNMGIECSKGKYIALMDDDDIAVVERLRLQVDFLEKNPEIDVLGGRSNVIDSHGKLLCQGGIPRYNPKYIKAMLLFRCTGFSNGTTMMRKDFIDKYSLRYQEDCYGMQDFKFFIDSSKKGNISSISDLLLYYRNHNANETKNRLKNNIKERKYTYAKFQRESLNISGYKLDREKMLAINTYLAEYGEGCRNKKELQLLYEAFSDIICQARNMKVDYLEELEHYCKLTLSNQVKNLIHF